ncbi:MAG: malto-oligosyltrehalose synthase [Beutenbergiaceae bacterium]
MPHLPLTSYRLQLGPDLRFDQAGAALPYLHRLGITDLYLSPILAAAPGSTHGYDVVDHSHISEVIGGRAGLERLVASARGYGMGVLLDIVPNHMAMPPAVYLNKALWSALSDGPGSPFASWFDVDLAAGPWLLPILGRRIGEVLAADELSLERAPEGVDGSHVLRYFDHVLPVRAGTEHLALPRLLEQQHYRLAYWKVGDTDLNYRRFFDVQTLVGIRVERPEVFAATHALVAELIAEGLIDGLRVDHPDGLADPRGYFRQLAQATGGAWTVAEKILEPDEVLPLDWPVAGTTGYDAAWRIGQVQIDPAGAQDLAAVMTELAGDTADSLADVTDTSKRQVITGSLVAELERLSRVIAAACATDIRLRDHTLTAIGECVRELLVACDRYRAYVVPAEPAPPESVELVTEMARRAAARLHPDHHQTLAVVLDLVLGRAPAPQAGAATAQREDIVVRFQQVCGAVMAKGVEDTTFYRWTHLTALCEVGAAPGRFAIDTDELHAWAQRICHTHPASMTNGSTHDSKRGEDVRARIGVLSQMAPAWREQVAALRQVTAHVRPAGLNGRTENFLWQTLAGTWTPTGPLPVARFADYLVKAAREAKDWTGWTDVNEGEEQQLREFAAAVLDSPQVAALMERWTQLSAEPVRVATLVTKALQLTLPGVADIYQGTETTTVALVDPDNRRPVDFAVRERQLAGVDGGNLPSNLGEEKLQLVAAIARLRRKHPGAFVGPESGYLPLPTSSAHAIAYARTQGAPVAITIATRLPVALQARGGWGSHTITLPPGSWREVVSGIQYPGGQARVAQVLGDRPVAVLACEGQQ